MMMKWLPGLLLCLGCISLYSQQDPNRSIHQEQSTYYSQFRFTKESQFDSLNGLKCAKQSQLSEPGILNRMVFGYHPYWMGSTYLSYHWDLISDLCYFSFEVDPYTGMPVTLHNWLTAPVIDTALSKGVNVHLCITLFHAHMALFSNLTSQQTLIDTAISLVLARNAKGVNLDFESVPSSLSNELNQFLCHFAQDFHEQLPDKMVSIAVPGIDSYGIFDLKVLEPMMDMFMIMGYDYYWNGSSMAGPVDGLYSMVSSFNYNLSRTVSWYQHQGVPNEKLVLGLPYYGRQWPVQESLAPSPVTGWGTALAYYTVRNNGSGNYSNANKHWESSSFSPYFSFQSNGWYQCFINDVRSLGKRFDLVNLRGLAGIGIWALGYDHGYDEFWQLIQDKFTTLAPVVFQDTLYDSGGPAFPYYADEDYLITIDHPDCKELQLTFQSFDLENNVDYLLVHDGKDTTYALLGQFSGDSLPPVLTATHGAFTLHFVSDEAVNFSGWKAIWHCGPMSIKIPNTLQADDLFRWFPNPVIDYLHLNFDTPNGPDNLLLETFDVTGKQVGISVINKSMEGNNTVIYDPREAGIKKKGLYFTRITLNGKISKTFKWLYSGQ